MATDTARDEIRALRDQVNHLMDDRVTPVLNDTARRARAAAADYSSRASDAAHQARGYAEDQAEMVSDRVRDQPLIAIGVAVAVGFLFGRITK